VERETVCQRDAEIGYNYSRHNHAETRRKLSSPDNYPATTRSGRVHFNPLIV
jgi:hypothetical protein